MNFFVKILPWRAQSLLGYRPEGVIDAEAFKKLSGIKVIEKHYPVKLDAVLPPVHVEEELHDKFKAITIERIREFCSDFFCADIGRASQLELENPTTIIKDNKILLPLSFDSNRRATHPALSIIEYPKKRKLKGKCLTLTTSGAINNYFYWTLVLSQKIGFLKSCGYSLDEMDYILINKPTYQFQMELIDLFDIPKEKIIETKIGDFIECEQMIALPRLRDNYFGFEFVRETMLNKIPKKSVSEKRLRIYCSRRMNKTGRRIENEMELEIFLKDYGFETIIFEDFSVIEQAALMNNTEIFIAPHGAGMTNIIYAEQRTKIIELHNKNIMNPVYWISAMYTKLDYAYLLCDGVAAQDQKITEHLKNIEVDIPKLKRLFDKMEIV